MFRKDNNLNPPANATTALRKIIHERSPLSFAEFMELCLYHPEHGYYAKEPKQVGRAGDFFTSVSSGPLFGRLIAEKIASWWREETITGPWRILEPGPNNGDLARDILTHLQTHHPNVASELTYVTLDPLPLPRTFQQKALASFGAQVQCLANTSTLSPLPTFVIANEILDAFPCRVIERREDGWQELFITSLDFTHSLIETFQRYGGAMPQILLHQNYPIGYRTELRDQPLSFFKTLQDTMTQGRLLFFDYGFAEAEYYEQQRTRGTLRVYRNHVASENPYTDLGSSDLTAHVDFTSILKCAQSFGMRVLRFEPQEFFLTRLTMPMVQRGFWQDSWQQNFQTLTHPSHLGGKFHAFELSWQEQEHDEALALQRLM